MSSSKKNPKRSNLAFDYYETSITKIQEMIKILNQTNEYIDNTDKPSVIRSAENVFFIIHGINRISMVPVTDDKLIYLSGAQITKSGEVVLTSNCHGGIMKNYKNVTRRINTFNKEMKCDGLKIKTILKLDGTIIELNK
jgi:hypothetical protein